MGGHALAQAISRAGLAPEEVQDVVFGCALPAGVTVIPTKKTVRVMNPSFDTIKMSGELVGPRALDTAGFSPVHVPEKYRGQCFASDVAMEVTTNAVQLFGGYGYPVDLPVERYMRDAKITQIYDGTNRIQRAVMACALAR